VKDVDFIAHVLKMDDGNWAPPHKLSDHLRGTAKLATTFANAFNSGAWGNVVG